MTADQRQRPFAVTHRGVLAIAVPMTLAYLTTPLIGIVNMGVVGQMGDAALVGGIAIGALIFDIVFTTFNFLRAGTTSFVAQAHGASNRTEVAAALCRDVEVAQSMIRRSVGFHSLEKIRDAATTVKRLRFVVVPRPCIVGEAGRNALPNFLHPES